MGGKRKEGGGCGQDLEWGKDVEARSGRRKKKGEGLGFEPFGSLKTGRFNRFTDPTADFDSLRPAQRPNRSDRSGAIFNTQVILLVLKLKTNKLSNFQNLPFYFWLFFSFETRTKSIPILDFI